MSEHEPEGYIVNTRIGSIEMRYDTAREPDRRCAEMVVRAMREPSKTVTKGYVSAAQWFALASKEIRDA